MVNKQDRFDSLFQYVCQNRAVEWRLAKAIAIVESSLNPMAVSPAGAKGLMQLMDGTAGDMHVIQVFDPEENITGGVKYFYWLFRKYQRTEHALGAYNGGFGYINEAQHLAIGEGLDPDDWDDVKGMLWRKDCKVGGKTPRAGQIVAYVEKVMKTYEELRRAR